MNAFLASTHWIDWDTPEVLALARRLGGGARPDEAIARDCFLFVRDRIRHSRDAGCVRVTCRASDVLAAGTGYCYAKSHLLAALLRANGIPAGLCYQRLSVGDGGAPYCLHGLNAVYLLAHGWLRIDARGNKPGVDARFQPPGEYLAFPVREAAERDFDEIWPDPLPVVVDALTRASSVEELYLNLPDIAVLPRHRTDAGLEDPAHSVTPAARL